MKAVLAYIQHPGTGHPVTVGQSQAPASAWSVEEGPP